MPTRPRGLSTLEGESTIGFRLPAAVLSVLVQAKGLKATNAGLLGTNSNLSKTAATAKATSAATAQLAKTTTAATAAETRLAKSSAATTAATRGEAAAHRQNAAAMSGSTAAVGRFRRGAATAATVLGIGGLGLIFGLAAGAKAGADFEKKMDTAAAVTRASAADMRRLEKQALDLGEATQFSAGETADAQIELAKGGLKVKQILGGALPAALDLAAAGELDLAEAAATTVNAMKLFELPGRQASQIADMLATAANTTTADVLDFAMALRQGGSAAKQAGLDLNNTMVVLEALAEAGIKNSDAGTSLKTSLIQLLKPTKAQEELAKALGIEWINQAGAMKGAVGISRELRQATADMTKAERAKTFAVLAGTDGFRTLSALYDAGPAKLERLAKANLRTGTAQEVAQQKMDNLAGDAEQLSGAVETLAVKLEAKANPALRTLTQLATGVINTFSNWNLESPTRGAITFGLATVAIVVGLVKLRAGLLATRIALAATFALMTRHPLGLLVVGAGLAAGALYGLIKSTDATSDSQRGLQAVVNRQRDVLGGLATAGKRLQNARQGERQAAQNLKAAEDRLARARSTYGPNSRQAIMAEAELVRWKRRSAQASREVREADQLRGVELRATKALLPPLVREQAARVTQLRREQNGLKESLRIALDLKEPLSEISKIHGLLTDKSKQADRASRQMNETFIRASRQVNPQFADGLRKSAHNIIELGTSIVPTRRQLIAGFARIEENLANMVDTTGQGLEVQGHNVNSVLGGFGVEPLKFQIQRFKANQKRQTGGFIVPGTGSGDSFTTSLAPGWFIMNREATRRHGFDRGGTVPVALEPGERAFSPTEVSRFPGGARTLSRLNGEVPRFQAGGEVGRLAKLQMAGPAGPLLGMGQGALDATHTAAVEYIAEHRPKGGFAGLGNAPGSLLEAMGLARSMGLTITSTTGGEHAPNSWHYKGRAFDASNGVNTPQEREYAIAAAKRWGRQILELFFDPLGWYIKNGQKISGAIGDHSDHVHTAMQLGGLVQMLAEGGWVKTGYTTYSGSGPGAFGSLSKGDAYAELGTATEAGVGTGSGYLAKALGRGGELPANYALEVKIGSIGKVGTLYKRDRGYGDGNPFYSIDLHTSAWDNVGLTGHNKGVAFVRPAGGGALTEGQKTIREAKARKANYEQQIAKLRGRVADAKTVIGRRSALWQLIKAWARFGMFDKDERPHMLDAVQNAASQAQPEGTVQVLSHLAGWANQHGEITGRDPDAWHSMTDAVQRAIERGRKERERVMKKAAAVRQRKAARIAARGDFPELVAMLQSQEGAYNEANQSAERLVALEPENVDDTYVGQERGAWGSSLDVLGGWRDKVVEARDHAQFKVQQWGWEIDQIKVWRVPGVPEFMRRYNKMKWRIAPLREAVENGRAFLEERQTELVDLQGFGGPQEKIGSVGEGTPWWLTLGGPGSRIFDTQNTIRELALKVANTGGPSQTDTERADLAEKLLREEQQRRFASDAHAVVLENWDLLRQGIMANFAGGFQVGGTIPPGRWGIVGERGPEPVAGPGTVFSHQAGQEMFGGSGGVSVVVNGTIVQEPGDDRPAIEVRDSDGKLVDEVLASTATGRRHPSAFSTRP